MIQSVIAFLAPGGGEMLVIMLALLLLFGPQDAPRILRRGLEALRKVQHAAARFKHELLSAGLEPEVPDRARAAAVEDRGKSVPPPAPPPPVPPPGETPP